MLSWASRKHLTLFGLVFVFLVLSSIHATIRPNYAQWIQQDAITGEGSTDNLASFCSGEDPFVAEYGRTNIRLSRAYEGSYSRLQRFLRKAQSGEDITIAAIGGSVTKGHQVNADEIWFHKLGQWLQASLGREITSVNGAAPATGSDYFSFCFPLHIPSNADLVIVELAVNDEGIPEHVENMENLLRGLLDLDNKPAVILAEVIAFSNGGMGGGGGRMHLPVAQYYDVPVISQRHPLANHFARYPQLVAPYFARDGWGNPDTRHVNARGHRDLAMLIASMIRDAACSMDGPSSSTRGSAAKLEDVIDEDAQDAVAVAEAGWPAQAHSWKKDGELMPGMWMGPNEYGQLPRMRILEGWNPDVNHVVPPFHPTCLSTRSHDPRFNLTLAGADGWVHWTHPDFPDKPYLVSHHPGSKVTFRLETNVGVVKMYSLRSRTFGLGTVECWTDNERHKAVRVEGYWDNGSNIGRFATIRDDLPAGIHNVTCELLQETADPQGGHEFRIISIMSV